jgi:sn-glycerol 3-phosphate transport system substrate-binding protein
VRRSRFVFVLFVALGLVAAACGGSSNNSSSGDSSKCPVDAFEKASKPTDVTIWSSYVGKTEQTLEKLASEYNATHPKVKVTVEVQGTDYAELLNKFKNAVPTKKLPAITIGEDIDTQYMVDSGVVLPAQDCIDVDKDPRAKENNIQPAIKAAYTVNGKQYPATMNVSTIVLYYNKDHFRRAGLDPDKPPATLAEVMADARKLKDAGVTQKPFVMKMDPWFVEQWISGAGADLVNKDNGRAGQLATQSELGNPASKEALDWLQSMNQQGLLNAVPGTDGQINHYFAMATQSSSMLLETSAAITTIDGVLNGTFNPKDLGSNVNLPPGLKIQLDLGVGLNPGLKEAGKGQVGGGAWYITNTGTDAVQSAAWDFVKWFNEVPQQVTWTQEGSYLPLLPSVKADPGLAADWTTSNRGKWLATAYEGITLLDPKHPGALIGPYDKYRIALRSAIESITLQNDNDVDGAIKTANTSIDKALKDYADSNF